MKRKFQVILTATTASLLAMTALGQDGANPKKERADGLHASMVHPAHRLNGAGEKRMIGEIANNIARIENLDNHLEVK